MALCPDHGGYTGDACKKCQEPNKILGPVPSVDRELNKMLTTLAAPPELDSDDQLALYRLERDITVNQQKAQTAQAQLYNFMKVMFEKYGVDGAKYTLDMEKMEFVARGM